MNQPGIRVDVAGNGTRPRIEIHAGSRESLRSLFELAEDSRTELGSYLERGRVLVAVTAAGAVLGHLQLVDLDEPGPGATAELKNMAVETAGQGRGIGRELVGAALELLASEGYRTVVVATAAADIGNLRFYQRAGFRMRSVERDAFTPATGYPPGLRVDGIDLRDRVWLDVTLNDHRAG